ncbi:MAG: hypothetical protein ACD_12C00298G0001, partial [uncultured bacterium]
YSGSSNKGESGIANIEIDGTAGNDNASCSGGLDDPDIIDLPEEPTVTLKVNGNYVEDDISFTNGTMINLSWESEGADNLILKTKVGNEPETSQDVTGRTSLDQFSLENDVDFTITATNTATNAGGQASDKVRIFQFGSANMKKGIHIIDDPTNLDFSGTSGVWDDTESPIFDFNEADNTFKGEVEIQLIVPENICNKLTNERYIKNKATLIPYLGTYNNNSSTSLPLVIETPIENVQCGVSIGGNIRAGGNINDSKITFKDETPSLLIVGENSPLSDPQKSNIQFLKYDDLINTGAIKERINRLLKESAKSNPPQSGSIDKSGIWKIAADAPNKTISGSYKKKNTFIINNGGTVKISNLDATQSVGIIAKDTNVEIEGTNKNIAIFAYDTGGVDDGNVEFINSDISFTGAIVAENIKLNDKTGDINWSSALQTYVPEGFSEILKPLISEKAP